MMEEAHMAKVWLQNLADGGARELKDHGNGQRCEFKALDAVALSGLQVVRAEKGRILCIFVVPKHLADRDGNWSAGAIATMIDDVGATALYSFVDQITISIDFVISYFSTAKMNEEVEVEAKVLGPEGKVSAVAVEVRKKASGEIIAIGKQWMTAFQLDRPSKL